MRVQLQGEQALEYTSFAEGWLQGEQAWGRPVDVQVMPDGALLVSDDYAGAIYRISYQK
jgi:glucose/arabinose dehydrogenase